MHPCVCSEVQLVLVEPYTRNVGSPAANTSSKGPVLNNACAMVFWSFDAGFVFGLQTRFMANCLANLSAIDTVVLRACCSSSRASPSIGAGSSPKRSCRGVYPPCLRRRRVSHHSLQETLLTRSVTSLIQRVDLCCPLHQCKPSISRIAPGTFLYEKVTCRRASGLDSSQALQRFSCAIFRTHGCVPRGFNSLTRERLSRCPICR